MTEDSISQQALARKKRFLEEKSKFGVQNTGTVVQRLNEYRLYFNNSGDIVCLSNEKLTHISSDWITAEFDQLVLQNLKSKDLNKFWVMTTPSGYKIKPKPINTFYSSILETDMIEIMVSDNCEYDIMVQIQGLDLIVTMSEQTKKKYAGMYPISATIQGKRILNFFIVDTDYTNFILQAESISMVELLVNDRVIRPLVDDLSNCKVFTVPLFDKYTKAAVQE
jgi:hypothetical protein